MAKSVGGVVARLLAEVSLVVGSLSGKRGEVTLFVRRRCSGTTFVATSGLNRAIKIDRDAIIHFTARLNCSNCPGLRGTVRRVVHGGLASIRHVRIASGHVNGSGILSDILGRSVSGVHEAVRRASRRSFTHTISRVYGTRHVCVFNIHSATTVTGFLTCCFRVVFSGIHIVADNDRARAFRRVFEVASGSIVVNVSFPHCDSVSIRTVSFTHSENTRTVTVASDVISPLIRDTSSILVTEDSVTSVMSSLITPLDLVGTLVITAILGGGSRISSAFHELRLI